MLSAFAVRPTNVGVLEHFPDMRRRCSCDWTSLDTALGHIASHEGVWTATGSEVIDWCFPKHRLIPTRR
jgi:hypothetical protein